MQADGFRSRLACCLMEPFLRNPFFAPFGTAQLQAASVTYHVALPPPGSPPSDSIASEGWFIGLVGVGAFLLAAAVGMLYWYTVRRR